MKGSLWKAAALLAGLLLFAGCTLSSNPNAQATPTPTPSPSPSPSPSPTQASTPASITGIPMPMGEVGIAYAASLGASGGPTPYTWSIDSGALPDGLSMTSDGMVSGVPTTPGSFTLTVKASDATNQYTTQGATIKIAAHLAVALVPGCAQDCAVEQGCINVCGTFGSQTGGVGPFSYQATGNIPGGMKLSGLSLAGSFPNLAQFWQFNVTVTDALGATGSLSPIFYVYRHITITGSTIPGAGQPGTCGNSPSSCTWVITYTGGTPGGTPSVVIAGIGPVNNFAGPPPPPRLGLTNGPPATPCSPTKYVTPTGLPPHSTISGGGGTISIQMGAGDFTTWCGMTARVAVVLVDQSPCGAPTHCTSSAVAINIEL